MSRINVYTEELTDRVEVVTKQNADGVTFTGLRFVLSGEHNGVTFWAPAGRRVDVLSLLKNAVAAYEDYLDLR